jgi:DNA-directed RNA polymerase specialized sigma24 family protein
VARDIIGKLFAFCPAHRNNRVQRYEDATSTLAAAILPTPGFTMTDEQALSGLLDRALRGDQLACSQLVRQLEPVIRRAVRVHLPVDDPLRRCFDSLDISQSVLMNFLAKAEAGAIQFQNPAQLRVLLRQMAAQRFIDKKRFAEADRRDCRRDTGGRTLFAISTAGADPAEIVAERELYEEIRRSFSSRERELADLWVAGHTFAEIAERLRNTAGKPIKPNAVRMALQRAFLRVAGQLEDPGDRSGAS